MFNIYKCQALYAFGIVLPAAVAGYSAWQHFHQPEPVTPQQRVNPNPVDTDGRFSVTLRCRQAAYVRYSSCLRLVLRTISAPLAYSFKADTLLKK
ncbi:hypothetical protein [Sporomusa termitida]|uniref:Secreted protein n=1 Tax=Sporomusa termitida TaxID=2377 RepID=A0A517DSZ6_9FIRM|nr:hypothetical protein [Sporomusa termitida]QDR80467.1 hypothetical protein SPTER_17940 [Sporomusa termitida]